MTVIEEYPKIDERKPKLLLETVHNLLDHQYPDYQTYTHRAIYVFDDVEVTVKPYFNTKKNRDPSEIESPDGWKIAVADEQNRMNSQDQDKVYDSLGEAIDAIRNATKEELSEIGEILRQ